MLEANSNFFQGGALRAKQRSAAYAEQAAKAEVQSVYLDVLDQIRLIREQIDNKQKQMEVLALRKTPLPVPKNCIKNNINWAPVPWWTC